MVLLILAVAGLTGMVFAFAVRHADRVNAWLWVLPQRLRARGWGLLLLPVAMSAAMMAGGAHGLIPAELGLAALAIGFAPKLAAKLVPYGVLGLAAFGVHLAKTYRDGNTSDVQYVFLHAGPGLRGAWPVLVEAGLLFAAGLWLLLRLESPGAGLVRALAARWLDRGRAGISTAQALLLIPVMGLVMQLFGPGHWFGVQSVDGLDAAVLDLATFTAGAAIRRRQPAGACGAGLPWFLTAGAMHAHGC